MLQPERPTERDKLRQKGKCVEQGLEMVAIIVNAIISKSHLPWSWGTKVHKGSTKWESMAEDAAF